MLCIPCPLHYVRLFPIEARSSRPPLVPKRPDTAFNHEETDDLHNSRSGRDTGNLKAEQRDRVNRVANRGGGVELHHLQRLIVQGAAERQ